MNYLSVENISKSFGDRMLFEGLSFGINKDQKIGFVAKNGTGKTTLLNIIAGDETPDNGNIIINVKTPKKIFLIPELNLIVFILCVLNPELPGQM